MPFKARRSHGHTCDRDHFKRDAEASSFFRHLSLLMSKSPLFKEVSRNSPLPSSLLYLSHSLSPLYKRVFKDYGRDESQIDLHISDKSIRADFANSG